MAEQVAGRVRGLAVEEGRAEAYALAASVLGALLDQPPEDAAAFLKACLTALFGGVPHADVLRDVADLLEARRGEELATEIRLLRARATDLDHPDDPGA
ncbi:MAG: hypothetical protein HQL40_09400, partial [Alphaproteobacteria bacterium]|nr:hypothetical protein [Alphaproteobacteria bacterium]